jgi:hypothetical protein
LNHLTLSRRPDQAQKTQKTEKIFSHEQQLVRQKLKRHSIRNSFLFKMMCGRQFPKLTTTPPYFQKTKKILKKERRISVLTFCAYPLSLELEH